MVEKGLMKPNEPIQRNSPVLVLLSNQQAPSSPSKEPSSPQPSKADVKKDEDEWNEGFSDEDEEDGGGGGLVAATYDDVDDDPMLKASYDFK
jgi:hypothetical protein